MRREVCESVHHHMRRPRLAVAACTLSLLHRTLTTMSYPPPPSTLLSARSICDRYTDETYAKMRDDAERTTAYQSAIQHVAPGRVCLDIGTGSLALLAVLAAQAGARHVYAVEANAEAADAARAHIEAQGLTERVTVLTGYSTDVELPERVDLLLHEILGEIASAEGVVAAVRDAAARHLAPSSSSSSIVGTQQSPGPVSVPARARSLLAPAEFPSGDYFAALPHPMLAPPGATALKLPSLPLAQLALAPAQAFEELDFEAAAPEPTQAASLAFEIRRDGELRGLAVHIEVEMLGGAVTGGVLGEAAAAGDDEAKEGAAANSVATAAAAAGGADMAADDAAAASASEAADPPHPPRTIDISSARPGSHWPNVFLMLPDPVPVSRGQAVVVSTHAQLSSDHPKYSFEVRLAGSNDDEGAPMRLLGTMTYP